MLKERQGVGDVWWETYSVRNLKLLALADIGGLGNDSF